MQNIKIEINGVTKNLVLLDMNKEANKAAHFINGKWYQEVEEKDYEILSFRRVDIPCIYTLVNGYYYNKYEAQLTFSEMMETVKTGYSEIFSVKRLSDNEVFAVGEEDIDGKITEFLISGDSMWYRTARSVLVHLNNAEKVKPTTPTVLLTTNEGVGVINPSNKIFICHKDFSKGQTTAGAISTNQNNIYFYDKKARDNYIIQNKPVAVSCIEIAKAVTFTSDQLNQLVEFFKSKNS